MCVVKQTMNICNTCGYLYYCACRNEDLHIYVYNIQHKSKQKHTSLLLLRLKPRLHIFSPKGIFKCTSFQSSEEN